MHRLLQLNAGSPRRRAYWLTTGVGIGTLLLAAVYLVLDAGVAVSLAPWFGLVYALAGAAPGLLIGIWTHNRRMLLVVALFITLIAAAPWLDIGPRKPFLRAAHAIAPGMTLTQVDQQMHAFERFPATPGAMSAERTVVYRHLFDLGDIDAVVVSFDGDRVSGRQVILD